VSSGSRPTPLVVGRYSLHEEIASGGMATVHLGRLAGAEGFSRTVAVKRLHPQFAKDPEFSAMLLDEARVAARVRHPNVVPTLDVVAQSGELFLVMEYVQGESLARLVRAARRDETPVPLPVVLAIMAGVLHGLHAAHEARDEHGTPLDIIHRDVSPQNVLVGVDGVPRILDFGIARAVGRAHTTRDGEIKGKLAYMSPEQLRQGMVDRRTDIYAAGVVLWELLTSERLFWSDSEGGTVTKILEHRVAPPSTLAENVSAALDAVTLQALALEPSARFGTARQMALALERCGSVASPTQLGEWVDSLVSETLATRARIVADVERGVSGSSDVVAAAIAKREAEPTLTAAVTSERAVGRSASSAEERTSARSRRRRVWTTLSAFVAGVALTGLVVVGTRAPATKSTPLANAAPLASAPAEAEAGNPAADLPAAPPTAPAAAPSVSTNTLASAPKPKITPPATTHRPCAVKSYVDDTGVKHFYKDCPK
jgi:serine/threonine-protein kinase